MLTLLNTSILTAYGVYDYYAVSLEHARKLVLSADELQSAIGHQSTAEILSELLGITVAVNRIAYVQSVGDTAIVFKLKGRAPEGKILSREEIEAMGYEFGVLMRIE
jgi:hypothetical protein